MEFNLQSFNLAARFSRWHLTHLPDCAPSSRGLSFDNKLSLYLQKWTSDGLCKVQSKYEGSKASKSQRWVGEGSFSPRSLGSTIHSMCSGVLVSFPFSIIRDEDGICRCWCIRAMMNSRLTHGDICLETRWKKLRCLPWLFLPKQIYSISGLKGRNSRQISFPSPR